MRAFAAVLCCAIASSSSAALIHIGPTPPADPENYIKIQVLLINDVFSRPYLLHELPVPNYEASWEELPYTSHQVNNRQVAPFWVPLVDHAFGWRLSYHLEAVTPDVAEFILAGDTELTLTVDVQLNAEEPWHVFQWTSPNLGSVERVYQRVDLSPEPGGALLALACLATNLAAFRGVHKPPHGG